MASQEVIDPEVARIKAKLAQLDRDGVPVFATTTGRIAATVNDPAAFAWLYLRNHITDTDGNVSFSEVHLNWIKSAKRWRKRVKRPGRERDAFLAPRSMGKSTWWFLILPMWGAAMGHVKFVAAFADSATQAESHLSTFKSELDRNALLQADFPALCQPMVRPRTGRAVADNQGLMQLSNGFVFTARGVDAGNLGMKVGDTRPDVIICDDLEPGESNYSPFQAQKRLTTLLDDILPLNVAGRAVLVGTTTMAESITDQLRQNAIGARTDANRWVDDEHFRVHFTPAIALDAQGARRSIWPEKWPLPFLESIEHTRQFAKNYALSPLGNDGGFWSLDDFITAELDGVTRVLIEIDPAVTSKKTSDYTGIAVIGWAPQDHKAIVLEALQVKLSPKEIRSLVVKLIDRWNAGLVRVETNQGGDLWTTILWGLPVPVKTVHETAAKEVRAAAALEHYQRGRVHHSPRAKLADLEAQMVSFPMVANDDLVDAVGAGVRYLLDRKPKRQQVGGVSLAYA